MGALSRFVKPMECTAVEEIPSDRRKWLYEVKLDGYRCCAVARNGKSFLYSRYGNSWPDRFPNIHRALQELGEAVVLDGEIVAVDAKGRPSFQQLQNWQSTRLPIVYYAFDITSRGGRDVRALPIEERKAILADLGRRFSGPLRLADTLEADLPRLVAQMKKLGLEGIVAKRRGSKYEEGRRSPAWLKHRFNEVAEFVIGGYIAEGEAFSRLLVGEWRDGKLMFVKKLKNGFTAASKKEVMQAIRGSEIDECPFADLPERAGSRHSAVDAEVMQTVTWVRPVRKVEAEFVEITRVRRLRHAYFRRLVD